MTSLSVTLKSLREKGACFEGYNKLVRALQGRAFSEDDAYRRSHIPWNYKEPITLSYVLESNGFDDALWALGACEQTEELDHARRLFGEWFVRDVEHRLTGQSSKNAANVTERFANGEAAWDAIWDAAWDAARSADWSAARAKQREKFIAVFCGDTINTETLYA